MLGIGFALLNAPTFALALAASAIYGLGYGFARQNESVGRRNPYWSTPCLRLNIMKSGLGRGCDFVGAARYELPSAHRAHATFSTSWERSAYTGRFFLFRMNFAARHLRSPLQAIGKSLPSGYPRRRPTWYFVFLCTLGTEVGPP